MLSSQAFDLGVGENLRLMGEEVDHKNQKGDLCSDFAFDNKIQNVDINIAIRISQSSATLEFVPEEARLLIADEDDQFFFQIRWVLHICQDFNCQDFELIIFGNVSAVQWRIQGGLQGLDDRPPPLSEGLGLPLLYVLLCIQAPE